jgi:hypothetical protein
MIKVLQKHNFFSQKYVCWADFDKNLFENLPMKPQLIQSILCWNSPCLASIPEKLYPTSKDG